MVLQIHKYNSIQIKLKRYILDEMQHQFQQEQNLTHQHMLDDVLNDVFSRFPYQKRVLIHHNHKIVLGVGKGP